MQLYGAADVWHLAAMILFTFAALAAADQAPPPTYPAQALQQVFAPLPPPVPPPVPPASPPMYPETPTRPKTSPGSWVTTEDYPAEALRYEQEGAVAFRLVVDRSGKVSDCAVTASSGYPVLDAQTCSLVRQRALFTPARDINGEAVTGTYANRVRWVIPAVPAPQAGYLVVSYTIDRNGNTSGCKIERREGAAPDICDDLPAKMEYPPGEVPAKGKRVRLLTSIVVEDQD